MFEQIEKVLSSFISLEQSEIDYFISKLQVRQLKRKEFLLHEGQVCKHSYFINSGCLRYFYNIEGQEVTGQFFFENGWYADYTSYLSGKPLDKNIQALEKTELLLLSKTDLDKLFIEIPKFEKFGRLIAENAFLGLQQYTQSLTKETPEERYINLIKNRPKVIERIPQHYIASYLGIKAPSLSRIRKRIFNNK
ncbi:MAG: CRP-like cAMP-binding protein [Psychroserpens sp.]|jgi:CRP-like cAMP-binding protein